jgi:hypothetical protein
MFQRRYSIFIKLVQEQSWGVSMFTTLQYSTHLLLIAFSSVPELILKVPQLRANICTALANDHSCIFEAIHLKSMQGLTDRLCGLAVGVLGYRSGGPGSIPGTT